jgi:hypothetical protein
VIDKVDELIADQVVLGILEEDALTEGSNQAVETS